MFFSRCRQVDHLTLSALPARTGGQEVRCSIGSLPCAIRPNRRRRKVCDANTLDDLIKFTDLAAFVPSQKWLSQVLGT
jgi:hypothetical protein